MARWRSRIPEMTARLVPAVEEALILSAEAIAEAAKERVPVGAPDVHLKDAIHTAEPVEIAGGIEVAVVAGNSKVFYGHMVEHGTTHSAPRPFLVPALEERAVGTVNRVRSAMGASLL